MKLIYKYFLERIHRAVHTSPLHLGRGRGVGPLLLLFVLASCHESEVAIPFSLSESEIIFPADGGQQTLTLSSDREWSVSSDCDWCLVNPVTGEGSTLCEIRVDSSYLYTQREAHLSFRSGGSSRQLTVRQFGYEKVIRLSKDQLEVPDFTDYDALFEDITVESNVDYDVTVEYPDPQRSGWLTCTTRPVGHKAQPTTSQVRLSYQMYMESDRDRLATVIFRQRGVKDGEKPVESRLEFRQTRAQEIIPSHEGDSLALLAISRIMHINDSWDTSLPMIYWNNVKLEDITYFNTRLQKTVTEPRVTGVSFSLFDTNEGIPYQIRYLDQLRSLSFTANANAHLKRISLGEHVTTLRHLQTLSLMGYGISELPESLKDMTELEVLELSGNNLPEIPVDLITALDRHKLWYVNLANNRRRDVYARLDEYADVRDTLGLHGELPERLFRLKNVSYIGLSYNYLEGSIPDMGYDASAYATLEEKIAHNPVMPQLEQLSINLNYLTGPLPDWILYHPNLRCWDPYTLLFNQYEGSRDSYGQKTGFTNEPALIEQACPLWWDDDAEDTPSNDAYTKAHPYNRQNTFDPHFWYNTYHGPLSR